MPTSSDWFSKVGFTICHTPGVSRAWRYEFIGGSYVLVMGLDGFDLPEKGGPYSAVLFSVRDEPIEYQDYLEGTKQLIHWFHHTARLAARGI